MSRSLLNLQNPFSGEGYHHETSLSSQEECSSVDIGFKTVFHWGAGLYNLYETSPRKGPSPTKLTIVDAGQTNMLMGSKPGTSPELSHHSNIADRECSNTTPDAEPPSDRSWLTTGLYTIAAAAATIEILRVSLRLNKRVKRHTTQYDRVAAEHAIRMKYAFRTIYTSTQTHLKIYDNHSHPTAAQERTHQRKQLLDHLDSMDLHYYEIHKGKHDVIGFNTFNSPRDLLTEPTAVDHTLFDALVGKYPTFWDDPLFWQADVLLLSLCDHYVDMVRLMGTGKTIIILGKRPDWMSYTTPDTITTTLPSSDEKLFVVNGGGRYQHHLYRYDQDHITVPVYNHYRYETIRAVAEPVMRYFDPEPDSVTYNVDRFEAGEQQYVFLTPLPHRSFHETITTDLVMHTSLRTLHALLVRRKSDSKDPTQHMEEVLLVSAPGDAHTYTWPYHAFVEACTKHTTKAMDTTALLSHATNHGMADKVPFSTWFAELYEYRQFIADNFYTAATRYHFAQSRITDAPYSKPYYDKPTRVYAPGDPSAPQPTHGLGCQVLTVAPDGTVVDNSRPSNEAVVPTPMAAPLLSLFADLDDAGGETQPLLGVDPQLNPQYEYEDECSDQDNSEPLAGEHDTSCLPPTVGADNTNTSVVSDGTSHADSSTHGATNPSTYVDCNNVPTVKLSYEELVASITHKPNCGSALPSETFPEPGPRQQPVSMETQTASVITHLCDGVNGTTIVEQLNTHQDIVDESPQMFPATQTASTITQLYDSVNGTTPVEQLNAHQVTVDQPIQDPSTTHDEPETLLAIVDDSSTVSDDPFGQDDDLIVPLSPKSSGPGNHPSVPLIPPASTVIPAPLVTSPFVNLNLTPYNWDPDTAGPFAIQQHVALPEPHAQTLDGQYVHGIHGHIRGPNKVRYDQEVNIDNAQRMHYHNQPPQAHPDPSPGQYSVLHNMNTAQHNAISASVALKCSHMQINLGHLPDYGVAVNSNNHMVPIHPVLLDSSHHLNYYVADPNTAIDAQYGRMELVNTETPSSWLKADHLLRTARRVVAAMDFIDVRQLTVPELGNEFTESARKRRFMEYLQNMSLLEDPGCRDKAGAFVKAETNDKQVPLSRNITNPPTHNLMEMSRYTLQAASALKAYTSGYLFQHSNKGVADILVQRSQQFEGLNRVATDYSKYDGTQNSLTFTLELMLFNRLFPDDVNYITSLLAHVKTMAITTGKEFTYTSYYTRQSGSAETSLMNTWVNMLIAVLAVLYRGHDVEKELPVGAVDPLRVECAFQHVLAGGDDGIAFDVDTQVYKRIVELFCLKIELEEKSTSDPVELLGRYYPQPLFHPGSIYAPNRLLTKISYGPKSAMLTALQMLYHKVLGYYVTDYRSHPVYTSFIDGIIAMVGPLQIKTKQFTEERTARVKSYMSAGGRAYSPSTEGLQIISLQYSVEFATLTEAVANMAKVNYHYSHYLDLYQDDPRFKQPAPPRNTPAAHSFRNSMTLFPDVAIQDLSDVTYDPVLYPAYPNLPILTALVSTTQKLLAKKHNTELRVYTPGASGPFVGFRLQDCNFFSYPNTTLHLGNNHTGYNCCNHMVPDTYNPTHRIAGTIRQLFSDVNNFMQQRGSVFIAIAPYDTKHQDGSNIVGYLNAIKNTTTHHAMVLVPNVTLPQWMRITHSKQIPFGTVLTGVHYSLCTTYKPVMKAHPALARLPTKMVQATRDTIFSKLEWVLDPDKD